jgi:tetratricopeptide (TPR) repeat protein
MMIKQFLLGAFLCCAASGALYAQQSAPAAAVAPVMSSTRPAAGTPGDDRDSALAEKVRVLKAQLHEEYHKERASTPEEARAFREKAVALTIEYHNLLRKKPAIPMLDDARFEIHRLIYEYPRISAHIFEEELEICRSTEAYDYKAQAESVYGDKDDAEADWTAAIKMSPEPELLRHRGYLYLQQRKYDQAIADFTAAIKSGDTAPAYHSRALAYFYKDDYADAADDLGQFFKLNTDKDYAASVACAHICKALRKRGFAVEGCAAVKSGEGGK